MAPFLATFPELIPVFAGMAGASYLQSLFQPSVDQLVLPANIYRPWEYADQVRRLVLLKHYGADEGDKIYTAEFSHRAIEIDVRSRSP
jgi:hypothetical protein